MYKTTNKKKFLIFIPAYNVEKKIVNVLEKIPKNIFDDYFIHILIIDDCSKDNTKQIIENYLKTKIDSNLVSLVANNKNYGYGGVQKIAFKYAIKNNFDYAIMLHGDGQYTPEKIPEFISNLLNSNADAVFGSRLIYPKDALKGGMPLYKFIGNRVLTFIQNLIIGTNMSEFHSGYRSYKINSLKRINFEKNTNDFHFDTEIIIQMSKLNYLIKEIPMPTFYGDEISHLKSIPYGINVLVSSIKYKFFHKD
jgi:glycosyltransferase involved in cell wall biosynthesis